MMKSLIRILFLVVILLIPALAFAQDAAQQQSWWQALLVLVTEVGAAFAVPILTALLYVLSRRWKLGIEMDTVEWAVSKAAGYGEQKAKQALRDGTPLKGSEIMKLALEQGNTLLVKKGLASKWGGQLADLIEAKLGEEELSRLDKDSKTEEVFQ